MPELPSRAALARIAAAIADIAPSSAFGFARWREDGRLSILYSYTHGFGEFILSASAAPAALQPEAVGRQLIEAPALLAARARAFEGFLLHNDVQRVISLPGTEVGARFWIGLTSAADLCGADVERFEAVARDSTATLARVLTPEEATTRFERLEQAAGLLPALLQVLDVRQVFDRLSVASREALPHDQLILFLFEEDLAKFRVYARSDRGDVDAVLPNPYPPESVRAWGFTIVDDHLRHPMEREAPATRMGARSSLRFPIWFDGRVIAGIGFLSRQTGAYGGDDVPIGRRLADHVGGALSHFTLAAQLAEQARRTEELRARATNLELLDELLASLTGAGDLRDVFERFSQTVAKVLPHDAAALLVHLPDGRHGRVLASKGYPGSLPETIEIPDDLRDNPDWDHDVFDDVAGERGAMPALLARLGFASLLRVAVRLDGQVAGALTFCARERGAYAGHDVLAARRIADRIAITLAHDRELSATRRADEAMVRAARLEARVQALTEELDARTGFRRVVGTSPSWRQVLTQATQVAAGDTTVLLLGESGTGKEVIARFVHRGSSRAGGPFVAINCAALPEQLLEAELFGYERGAYTGAVQSKPGRLEQAAGGTLFLDEVGEMSAQAQAKFLRVLQEREFQRLGGTRMLRTDARVVAATNRDLRQAIATGQFREDLYYRLNVFAIHLPPLRHRREDVMPLADAFLAEIGPGFGRPPAGISRDARSRLVDYHWPGNVRELRNILERAAILCDGGLITAEHLALPPMLAGSVPEASIASPPANGPGAPAAPSSAADLEALERGMIAEALRAARFNKSRAAKALGLTRHQLYIRLRKHGIE